MSGFKRILVPVDGSESSERAVKNAGYLAQNGMASIDLLYVANIASTVGGHQIATNVCLPDSVMDAVTKAGNAIIDKALRQLPENIEVQGFCEAGLPASVILDFCVNGKYDALVMGSRGLGRVKGMLLGSVSQYLVEHAPCPVMVVK